MELDGHKDPRTTRQHLQLRLPIGPACIWTGESPLSVTVWDRRVAQPADSLNGHL